MAKHNNNSGKTNTQPEKRGGILGFFDSIKNFFVNLIEKIKEKLEFDKRKDEGRFTSTYSQTPEGQAQAHAKEIDDAFGFQTWEEHLRNQEEFPGFQDMQISNGGLLTIPPKTALIWKNDTIQESAIRYNICMDKRFKDRPDPLATLDGRAFIEIAGIMRKAEAQGDAETKMFVLGTTFIQARHDAEVFHFNISNGSQAHEFTCTDKWDIGATMMREYTAMNAKGDAAIFIIDPTNNTRFAALRGDDNSFDAYTIKPVIAYSKDTKEPMPNIMQITGPMYVSTEENANFSLQELQVFVPQQGTEISDAHLRDVAVAAVRQAEKEGTATTYVVGDKVLWADATDGKTTIHITPVKPPSNDVRFHMQIPVTEKMFRPDNGNLKASEVFKAVQHGMSTLDGRLQVEAALTAQQQQIAAAEIARQREMAQKNAQYKAIVQLSSAPHHVDLSDIMVMTNLVQPMIGTQTLDNKPANVITLTTGSENNTHTLVLTGYERLDEQGHTVRDTRIELDGKCLYDAEAVRGEDGQISIKQNGVFQKHTEVFGHLQTEISAKDWTTNTIAFSSKTLASLPESFREQLSEACKNDIARYEAAQASEQEVPATDENDALDNR